ncbi:MAG: polymer-forming cytoskeletal protein [Desulfobacterales bacterium]|nr:polymer-forming cytoskeletal protein [Desulfobacterales bacterium]MDJ0885672.1 polymer-forming cytoskeletal protein [Desulfobacterales bacterium]
MENQLGKRPPSLIGRGITVEGELVDGDDLVIEGTVKGSIRSTGEVLVTPHGRVEATISAQRIVIQGYVRGDVRADETVNVQTEGVLIGNCRAKAIQIHEGARFEGRSDIIR